MRKTVIAFMTIAAILMAESCQKENEIAGTVSGSMTINAVAKGIDTKAELVHKYDVLWNVDDKIELSDTGKALSGAFDVTVGKAVIKEGEKGGIILDVNDSEIGVAARYFNLAVPAGKYGALTLKFYTNDGRAVTMTSSTMPEILHNTVAKVTLAVNGFSKYVQSISLDKSEISIIAGGHGRVNATLTPSDAGNKEIIWNSSDESVAKVIGNGSVIGIAPGTATITATTVDGGYSAQCEVSVTASAPRPDKTLPGVLSVGESKSVYFTKGNLKSDSHDFYFE